MASCAQIDSLLQAYIDEELASSEKIILEQHLSQCGDCTATLQRQRASSALMFEVFKEHRLQHDLRGDILAHLPEMDERSKFVRRLKWRDADGNLKHRRWWTLVPVLAPVLLLVLSFALIYSWPAPQKADATGIGMITARAGQTYSSNGSSVRRNVTELKEVVARNERFETGDGGSMIISLAGPSQCRLSENTRVKVLSDRRVSVEQGRVWLNVCKSDRYFRVNTPAGDVTVFGTTFDVHVLNDRTIVTVEEGVVQVDNNVAFAELTRGQQVELMVGVKPLVPRDVDAVKEMEWAADLHPDMDAMEAFTSAIKPPASNIMRAERVFKVETSHQIVHNITFEWSLASTDGHCGYFVYVSGDHSQPLFKGHLDATLFNGNGTNSFELPVPADVNTRDVGVLYITLVPDRSSGAVETSFNEVYAISK